MKRILIVLSLFSLLMGSCAAPLRRAHRDWRQTWTTAAQLEQLPVSAERADYIGAIEVASSYLTSQLPEAAVLAPAFLDPASAPTTQALTAWHEDKAEWLIDQASRRPFQLFFDLERLATARRRLEAKGYRVEVFPIERLVPWLGLETPLRLDWQQRPLAYSAETLAYNQLLDADASVDREATVEAMVRDFLIQRYGAHSLELEAFLARRADERSLQYLVGQLATALAGGSDTVTRSSYLSAWLDDYRQNYSSRFQTNLYRDINEAWLTPGRILLITEGWRP